MKLRDIPEIGSVWAIIKDTSVHHEGDERSRTNPGHGYPAYTEQFIEITEIFNNEEDFKRSLAHLDRSVRGFKLTPYTIKTTVEVIPST
jgi:hypothetical protein